MKRLFILFALSLILFSCSEKKNVYDPDTTNEIITESENKIYGFEVDYKDYAGVKTIHVKFNDAVSYDAIFDTGCSGLSISKQEFDALVKAETIYYSDLDLNGTKVTIADGTTKKKPTVRISTITVIDKMGKPHTINDVIATIVENQLADILIGTSIIDNLASKSYTVDLVKKVIRFE